MGRNPVLSELVRKTSFFSVGFLVLFAQVAQAQNDTLPLHYFKNYFITGDYVAAGIGLRGKGVNGIATGTINMNAVPCARLVDGTVGTSGCGVAGTVPSDIVAAFLYW